MDSQNNKYNLRSSKNDDEVEKDNKVEDKNVVQTESSDSESDSEYVPNDDSSVDEEDGEKLDNKEYNKFLLQLFPSKYMQSKVENEKNHDNSAEVDDESDGETLGSEDSETDDSENDEDDLFDFDDEDDFLEKNGTKFNIVFTVDASLPKSDELLDDDDDDDDASETDSDDSVDESENTKKSTPNKSLVKGKKRRTRDSDSDSDYVPLQTTKKDLKRLTPRRLDNTTSTSQDKSTKKTQSTGKKPAAKQQSEKSSKKLTKKSLKDDEKEMEELDDLMKLLKTKQSSGSDEVLKQFDNMISDKKAALDKKKTKYEKKQQVKNTKKLKKLLVEQKQDNELLYFKKMSVKEQENILTTMEEINKYTNVEKPYKLKLIESLIPVKYKAIAMRKLNALKYMDPGTGEYYKIKQWVDNFMMIPFGMYRSLPVCIQDGNEKCFEFMNEAKNKLNDAVYGLDDAKSQIMQLMGQWISNPDSVGSAIAIKGPMGTGKTTLIKEGISKVLNRPFAFLALGGATDSAFLEGHSYTYEGSSWGQIIEIIKQSKCMNPVIYFDELDKVSETAKGEEIIGILTHLTDTTQNSQFHDKYFSEIDFDLSKCLFIFSYNDERKVNPILRDRMYVIETKGYNKKEKTTIARDYLIPSIEKNINFEEGQINIHDDVVAYISENYTNEERGVRNLKRCLEIIYSKLNLYRLMPPKSKLFNDEETLDISFPFDITEEVVTKILKKGEKPQWLYSMYT